MCKILLRKYTVVTVHRDPNREGKIVITKYFLKKCNVVILVNKEGYNILKTTCSCKYYQLPAFLPPILTEELALPESIEQWIDMVRKDKDSILLVSNASNLVLNHGEDLYGLDLCIKMMELMKQNGYNNYYFIFVVASNTEHQDLMISYKNYIYKHNLKNLLLWEKPLSFVRLIKKSDIVLRTTNTDGDAISIREALFYNKKIVASDVAERPAGTILYRNRDANDLFEKVIGVYYKEQPAVFNQEIDYKKIYTEIYKNNNGTINAEAL